jgi:hypothetical protein
MPCSTAIIQRVLTRAPLESSITNTVEDGDEEDAKDEDADSDTVSPATQLYLFTQN